MTSNGLKKEAVKLQKILNEKYKLDLNYTSSLRIIEELKNTTMKNLEESIKTPPVAEPVFFNSETFEKTLVNNIKNINQHYARDKEKIIYFEFWGAENQKFTTNLENEEYIQYNPSSTPFWQNFNVLKFNSIYEFINLESDELNKLLNSVEKIFIDPMFFKVNDTLLIQLVHELTKEKFVGIFSPKSTDNLPRIYGIVENFENYYEEKYSKLPKSEFSKYYVIETAEMMKNYKKAFNNYLNDKELFSIKSGAFLESRKSEEINLGFDRLNNSIISWDYIKYNNLLLKSVDGEDVDYIFNNIERHFKNSFKHSVKILRHFKADSVRELEEFIKNLDEINNSIQRQGGRENIKVLLTIRLNGDLLNSEVLKNILSMGRSLQLHILLVAGRDRVPHDILSQCPLKIMFKGNFSDEEVNEFFEIEVKNNLNISHESLFSFFNVVYSFEKFTN